MGESKKPWFRIFFASFASFARDAFGSGLAGSRPVAGTAGDHLPHALVEFVAVLLDGKILAAHRAAYGDRPSAEMERGFLATGPAFHKNLKKLSPQRTQRESRNGYGQYTGSWFKISCPQAFLCALCGKKVLFYNVQLDRQVPELSGRDARRCFGHDANGLLRFRKRDHVADGSGAGQDGR
jgi:hypothetical protein